MNYEEAKIQKEVLDNKVTELSSKLNGYNKYRNELGLIPNHIKELEAFKIISNEYQVAFKRLQEFNKWFIKEYKKEYNKERLERRRKFK